MKKKIIPMPGLFLGMYHMHDGSIAATEHDKIKDLEAKLKIAVEALENLSCNCKLVRDAGVKDICYRCEALKKLKAGDGK